MKCCYVDRVKVGNKTQYFLRDSKDMSVIKEPSKYLKHKMKQNKSVNTIKSIAFSLCYYIEFLKQKCLTIEQVLLLKYSEQQEHFVDFLCWMKVGNHSTRERTPSNNTCNSHLQDVFGYYEFILLEYEIEGDIKVLENRDMSYSGTVGIRFQRSVKNFEGYLQSEESHGKTTTKEVIMELLNATKSIRNKLLILLMVETGFRIGEILGIKYGRDIDYDKHTIRVQYREDNENEARAKNAEFRRAKISDETFEILMFYISENRAILSKVEYLFVSFSGKTVGKAMTVDAVYSMLNLLFEKTGHYVTPHMFRHYFANERRKAGWTIEEISQALGHKNLETTMKYLDIDNEEMMEAMEQYYATNSGLYDVDKLIG